MHCFYFPCVKQIPLAHSKCNKEIKQSKKPATNYFRIISRLSSQFIQWHTMAVGSPTQLTTQPQRMEIPPTHLVECISRAADIVERWTLSLRGNRGWKIAFIFLKSHTWIVPGETAKLFLLCFKSIFVIFSIFSCLVS